MAAIRILNFDGSVVKQKRLLAAYKTEAIDFSDIGPRVRFWLNKNQRQEIKRRIGASARGAVTFLGSGDFHHIAEILISGFDEPVVLIGFDRHPDRSIIAPRYSCGSWLRTALEKKDLLECILVGARKGRLFDLAGPLFKKVRRYEFEEKELPGSFLRMIRSLPVKKVYITIDKDCLRKESALTNWEEGAMALEDLLRMLKLIKDNLEIVGADITGEYSKIDIRGIIKNIVSYFDHPRNFSARGAEGAAVDEINEDTNLKILKSLFGD